MLETSAWMTQAEPARGDDGLAKVKLMMAARSLRARYFNGDLFADPAWDLLLELYLADLEQRRISASALFRAGGLPQSTNFRWLARLGADGLLERTPDPLDARRTWVNLTGAGKASMQTYFAETEVLPSKRST
jgi:DNA-binding MarR family transcriptional regulator